MGLAAAGPALAAEEPAPAPPFVAVPEIPDIAPPEIPVPEIPAPELVEPPVVVTHVDAENVDVSIRILSPGEDGTVAQESETTAISAGTEGDITEETDDLEPADVSPPDPSTDVNTNVTIRVLSPGDRSDVTQSSSGGGEADVEAGADPPSPRVDAAPASTPLPTSWQNPEQYHEEHYQYQSDYDSWNWRWALSLDCAGNATSSSTETGRPESLVWFWEWTWKWGCDDVPAGDPTDSNASSSPPTATTPLGKDETSGDPTPATTGSWSWNWSFTFCGQTSTVPNTTNSGTPLTWTWDWSWTWSCGSGAEPDVAASPPAAIVVPSVAAPQHASEGEEAGEEGLSRSLQAADEPTAEQALPTVWVLSFPMTGPTTGATETATPFVWPSMPEAALELDIEIAIPPVVLPVPTAPPLTSPALPFPASDVPAEPTPVPSDKPTATPPSLGAVQALPEPSTQTAPPPQPRAHHARPAKHARAKSRRADRSPTPFPPIERPAPRRAAGTSNAGGFVPSALLLGVAALTGFVFLAAPGIGRRIRVARELSPRGLAHSPLDRPG